MADTETVQAKLPSGEVINAVIPAGMDDATAKAYMTSKRPDLFAPTPANQPGAIQQQPGGQIFNVHQPGNQPPTQQNDILTKLQSVNKKVAGVVNPFMAKSSTQAAMATLGAPPAEAIIPNAARAGQAIQDVAENMKFGQHTVDPTKVYQVARDINSMPGNKGPIGKLASDFIKRVTPTKGNLPVSPPTWDEMQQFKSAIGTMTPFQKYAQTSGLVRGQMGKMASAIDEAMRDAATKIGSGDLYSKALNEYHNAMVMKRLTQVIGAAGVAAAAGAAKVGGATALAKQVWGVI